MLTMLQSNKEAIVVMDAGIATEDNIEWLKKTIIALLWLAEDAI